MREALEKKYEALFQKYGLQRPIKAQNVNAVIKSSLQTFMKDCKRPAIYCNGGHTKMLMADFMCELKDVKYIVDNYGAGKQDGGFLLITDAELEANEIDAVIISSFKFRKDIVQGLKEKHPRMKYLDIYEKFAENGIDLQSDYYYHNHPYHHYHAINTLQRKIAGLLDLLELEDAYLELVTRYLHIKDFRTAEKQAEKLYKIAKKDIYKQLIADIEDIYDGEKKLAASVSADHVLMLCVDGLRRQDLAGQDMLRLREELLKNAYVFENAYSFSTSTYESLIPVYSENGDLRTKYYQNNSVEEEKCRFIKKAKSQGRTVHFYTDMDEFVESQEIRRSGAFQTVTEKIWSFLLDASEEKNGLFYIHVLYESHYSFSNPYTESPLISEGTALLFDYLPQKGEKLRTDYERQHTDALHYLDDVMTPFLHRLNCRLVLYADHGNLLLDKECRLSDVEETKLTCAEEWLRIPLVIKAPEQGQGVDNSLISLMELNNILDCLMEKRAYEAPQKKFVKAARSELYNPDFRYLYKEVGKEWCLQAFEAFIFEKGWKLVIFADGSLRLYQTQRDEPVIDDEMMKQLLQRIKKDVTVCDV